MLVPKNRVQERTESTPPQLVRLLFGNSFAGLRKQVVFGGRPAVHPAARLHPSVVDLAGQNWPGCAALLMALRCAGSCASAAVVFVHVEATDRVAD